MDRTGIQSESRKELTAKIQNWKNYSKKIQQKYSNVKTIIVNVQSPLFYTF